MSNFEIVGVIKDLFVACAAVTAAIVAVRGLGTWQRQLKGQTEYELTRRILVNLFKYRDAIRGVRHPVMYNHEMVVPPMEEQQNMSYEKIQFYGRSKAYENRLSKVHEPKTALYADLLESEALWGLELKKLFETLYGLEQELHQCIVHDLDLNNPDSNDFTRELAKEYKKDTREIMYEKIGKDSAIFSEEIQNAITEIESYLKPKLTSQDV